MLFQIIELELFYFHFLESDFVLLGFAECMLELFEHFINHTMLFLYIALK